MTCTTFPGGGPLNSGAVINGNKTLQVKYVAGRIGQTYAARGLSAFPRGFWTSDYYAPFGQAANANAGVTDYYLFNPNSTPLTINWQSQTTSGSFAIPGNSSQSYNRAIGANPSVPTGSGLYFSATSPFWGVGFGDATSQGTPTGQAFEWGFSLLPTTFLYKEHFMGWSPGSLPLTTAPTNGNGVFLTVGQDNTQVFVDYNNDGMPDVTYTLNRLQSQFVPPGPTGALDGARFYATGLFSMAYGENADTATTPTPNLDLGYVALPATDFVSLVLTTSKSANPAVVSTASGSDHQLHHQSEYAVVQRRRRHRRRHDAAELAVRAGIHHDHEARPHRHEQRGRRGNGDHQRHDRGRRHRHDVHRADRGEPDHHRRHRLHDSEHHRQHAPDPGHDGAGCGRADLLRRGRRQ